MLDCFARCYKEEGLRVFSQSYTVSSVRILPYKGIDMGLYGFMREKLVPEGEMPSVPLRLVMGGGIVPGNLQAYFEVYFHLCVKMFLLLQYFHILLYMF